MIPEYDALAYIYDIWAAADPAFSLTHDFYVQECCIAEGLVVELGVGTGRIAIDVTKNGHYIIGVDISPVMLELCLKKALQAGVEDRLALIQSDILTFHLPQKAHLITLPFRTIGHFLSLNDKKHVLKHVFSQLAPGGHFLFDHYIFHEQWARNHDGIPRLMHNGIFGNDQKLLIWDIYKYDYSAQQMDCLISLEKTDMVDKVIEKEYHPLHFSWITPEQVKALVIETGFEIEALYGDFHHGEFNQNANDQIWLLRKPK